MTAKKIACLGGGSRYFLRALPDILITEELGGAEIVLYDLNHDRADLMAATGCRLAEQAGTDMRVTAAGSLAEALDGADFAVSSIGGSGTEATQGVHQSPVHLMDKFIPAKLKTKPDQSWFSIFEFQISNYLLTLSPDTLIPSYCAIHPLSS